MFCLGIKVFHMKSTATSPSCGYPASYYEKYRHRTQICEEDNRLLWYITLFVMATIVSADPAVSNFKAVQLLSLFLYFSNIFPQFSFFHISFFFASYLFFFEVSFFFLFSFFLSFFLRKCQRNKAVDKKPILLHFGYIK